MYTRDLAKSQDQVCFRSIPAQPVTIVSYWNVGILLHLSIAIFIFESWFYWTKLKSAYLDESFIFAVFWLGSLLFAFSHIFFVIMDAWSRFQDYKRIKDKLYIHGFNPKIAMIYSGSKCQRTAFLVAAKELGMEQKAIAFYNRTGIRWYHFVPRFMIEDPMFLFKKSFVSRTFLEKHYSPKFNFREQGMKRYKIIR